MRKHFLSSFVFRTPKLVWSRWKSWTCGCVNTKRESCSLKRGRACDVPPPNLRTLYVQTYSENERTVATSWICSWRLNSRPKVWEDQKHSNKGSAWILFSRASTFKVKRHNASLFNWMKSWLFSLVLSFHRNVSEWHNTVACFEIWVVITMDMVTTKLPLPPPPVHCVHVSVETSLHDGFYRHNLCFVSLGTVHVRLHCVNPNLLKFRRS